MFVGIKIFNLYREVSNIELLLKFSKRLFQENVVPCFVVFNLAAIPVHIEIFELYCTREGDISRYYQNVITPPVSDVTYHLKKDKQLILSSPVANK